MQEQDSNLFSDVSIDETAKQHITGIASWAMVVVVTAVIGYLASVIGLFTGAGEDAPVQSEGFGAYFKLGSDSTAGVIFSVAIGLLINYFLYRFATLAKSSIGTQNQEGLTNGFRSLRIYFAITTVLMILAMLFVVIGVAAAL